MSPIKTTIIRALLMAIVLSAPLLFADNGVGIKQLPPKPPAPTSDRISDTELLRKKDATQSGFPHAQWSAEPSSTLAQEVNIYTDSIILQHENSHTVVPLHSVVYLPNSLKQKIATQPKGAFVPWPQFYIKNRNWLFTHEVTLTQARGTASLKKGIETQFERINRLVVAIHQNNPISVLSQPQFPTAK